MDKAATQPNDRRSGRLEGVVLMASVETALRGKRVLITGGAGGVGRAVAARMVSGGARVLIPDREEPALRELAGPFGPDSSGAVETVTADLSSRPGLPRLFDRVDDWLGGLDILIA